jgi:1-acyl-sn-glycerol-3-phosphate acyltransferase
MYRKICGVSYEVRGRENVPAGGCVIAMKHQSVWDTCAMFAIFDRPVYVLKSELMFIPFFGWALARLGCIPVKRGTGKSALDTMVRGTRAALAKGQQVVIFPEGTRTRVGQPANYKTGTFLAAPIVLEAAGRHHGRGASAHPAGVGPADHVRTDGERHREHRGAAR